MSDCEQPTGSTSSFPDKKQHPTGSADESSPVLPVELETELDRVCNEFEAGWKASCPRSIENALDGVAEPLRSAAVRELVALEVFYRKKAGGPLCAEEYPARFPELDRDWLAGQIKGVVPKLADHSTVGRTQRIGLPPGTVIGGRYTLVEVIGEGGMGTVYLASQSEPVKRQLALKLIKTGMDSKKVLARFDAERQALGMMNHPNIARVYDGGTTSAGLPFFVMELVNGKRLTDYCDTHKLSTADRLAVFVQVCGAVQHAHQKGIIHRDLKPSNILVESHDGKPVPKVIDFGLAKAAGGLQLTEQTFFSEFGNVVGTLAYMAPEQAAFNAEDVDTRADVYALGVILFELLTGTTPLTRETLKKAGMEEILRLIREQEPPTPSHRLSTSDSTPSVAANRQIEPGKLGRLVKGELDWIALKALSKDRDRRYETATGLARDIERFLHHEPVSAGPPSAAYRLRKFVRRNRPHVVATALVLFALVAGIVGTTVGLVQADEKRRDAEWAWGQEAEQRAAAEYAKQREHDRAEGEKKARLNEAEERVFAQAITAFVKDDFLALTSVEGQDRFGGEGLDRNTNLLDLLNRAAEKLRARKDLNPRIEAELCWIVGVNYRAAGEAAKGVPFLERTLQLRSDLLGRDHEDTLVAINSLAVTYIDAGQTNLALPLAEETLKLWRSKLGPEHRNTLNSMGNLANAYLEAGKLDLALPLAEETLELRRAKFGPEHSDTLMAMNKLARVYLNAGKLDLAVPLAEKTLKLMRSKLGPEHLYTLLAMSALTESYRAVGKLELALPLAEGTLKLTEAKLGTDHPQTLNCMSSFAAAYRAAGKLDLALPLAEKTLKLTKARLGPEHPYTLSCMNSLAWAYFDAGKLDLALPLAEETLKLMKAQLGTDHPHTLSILSSLAGAYLNAGKLDLALPLAEEALKLMKAKLGLDHPDTLRCMQNLAMAYLDAGRLDLAIPFAQEAMKLSRVKFGPDNPIMTISINNLALVYQAAGKLDLALSLFEEVLKLAKAKLGPDHPHTLLIMHNLAAAYRAAGKLELALPLFEETIKLRRARLDPEHPDTLISMEGLAAAYWRMGRLDKSIPLFEDVVKLFEKKLRRDHSRTQNAVANLGVNYKDAGRLKEAIPLLEEAYRTSTKQPRLRWVGTPLQDAYVSAGENAKLASLLLEQLPEVRQKLPKESQQLANLLSQIGQAFLMQKKWAEAEPLLRECMAIREKVQPDAWTTYYTQFMVGCALLGQKKYAETEPLLLKGYEGLKRCEKAILPLGKTHIPQALNWLIELYTATNKPDEAKKWRVERAKYPFVAPLPREKK